MDQSDLGLGDVSPRQVTQRLTFRRGVVLGFFLGDYLFAFETTHPDELCASSVDPSDLCGNPLRFMKRANALLKDLELGVHHAPVDSVYP